MQKQQTYTKKYSKIIQLWTIRILYDLKGYTFMRVRYGLDEYERVLTLLKQEDLVEKYEDETIPSKVFRKALKKVSDEIDQGDAQAFEKGLLFTNIRLLGDLVGLNEIEQKILAFGVLLTSSKVLGEATDVLDDISLSVLIHALSVILQEDQAKIRQALAVNSILNRTGLLSLDRDSNTNMRYHIDLMQDMATILLSDAQNDMMQALTRFFLPGQAAKLSTTDFSYLKNDYELVHDYLKKVTVSGKKGVNILIFGAPGTGKTELVRALATDLNVDLFEVTPTTNNGDDEYERARLSSYQLCQQILRRKNKTLILFDEIEDAFIRDGNMERFGIRTNTDAKKGTHNHMLEVNPIPTLWVSNVISHIDEAIIRRFDYVMEMKVPPKGARLRIIKQYTRDLDVSEEWASQIAKNERLAPALIARAVSVVQDLPKSDTEKTEANLQKILSNTLNAMGYDKHLSTGKKDLITYRLDALNPDYDLQDLQQGLGNHAQGCFCFYGPPGTGKSEFARYLADYLDKPLLVKRASDLLDAYIGVTEKNIKGMFEQAMDEEAVLLCDEADSFLRDRSMARQSWEVTQVNELLTQMERFNGLFICTTNLMEALDQASLRRFDLKIKFDYLKPEQNWTLFKQTLADQKQKMEAADKSLWEKKVRALQGLTPGDFATTVRQRRFSKDNLTAKVLFEGLEKEIRFKQYGAFKGMGFIIN